ncbi:uncharacterized protein STEHIDRAFT_161915 [Stereum hirsutum FP-91666 SS1]|uniref:uncharacterized protein n=1 Tax=Stereum hirsutum (strain FP-91666) TaxID=721885 RepID=UPI00044496AF|nr:uncharacterized protein STEHIDRAFT_161915 [Stereum hirsutum FP-91666 SS1]EIM81749.1 hypothetical protein STEHIDRAFT_161915 [Stereum hirsutum FP-91666 SS1]
MSFEDPTLSMDNPYASKTLESMLAPQMDGLSAPDRERATDSYSPMLVNAYDELEQVAEFRLRNALPPWMTNALQSELASALSDNLPPCTTKTISNNPGSVDVESADNLRFKITRETQDFLGKRSQLSDADYHKLLRRFRRYLRAKYLPEDIKKKSTLRHAPVPHDSDDVRRRNHRAELEGHTNSLTMQRKRFKHDQYNRIDIPYYRDLLSQFDTVTAPVLKDRLRYIFLSPLAYALQVRFEEMGQADDLSEAIVYHREVLSLLPENHPAIPSTSNSLAVALHSRYQLLGARKDLKRAITYQLSTVHATSVLRGALNRQTDRVITYLRQDLRRLPRSEDRSQAVSELAFTLRSRFDQYGDVEDLDEAIVFLREAVILRPPGNARRSMTLDALGQALAARFEQRQDAVDLHYALCLFQDAISDPYGAPTVALEAAQNWASYARQYSHPTASTAYIKALVLLDRCTIMYPTLELQQKFISPRNSSILAMDAASLAIEDDDFGKAVEFLEQGRALLWSRMRGYRYPIETLRSTHRTLADHFEEICNKLEGIATSFGRRGKAALALRHRELTVNFDNAVDIIRRIEGYSRFLRHPSFHSLRQAAVEGPVIVLNLSIYRSDAIIIPDATSDPTVVPLSSSGNFPEAIGRLSSLIHIFSTQSAEEGRADGVKYVLQRLWELIVHPIVEQLLFLGLQRGARIWWCPTGAFCSLPLHAAQPFDNDQSGIHDLYTSSYTPTLSSLIAARSSTQASRCDRRCLLAIGQIEDSLPRVQEELNVVQNVAQFVRLRVGEDASADGVVAALRDHPWLHLACHGHLDPQSFASSFRLHNATSLRVIDVIKARLPNAEFAFLSACHSAAVDSQGSPDEVLHLAAAMQFSGFKSVVGTLWGMADTDGPSVAKAFYGYLSRHGDPQRVDFRDSATALRVATKALRRAKVPIDRWVNFVHIGA